MSMDRFTGVTGNAIQDGLTRAGWVAAVQEELAILTIPITFVAVAMWGVYDAVRGA
ncbi:hypothetical protein LCGC14_1502830 [marine sediment metagenome]|uniref:Uncharacterized protein n=1 Tax=marine sediment metagenome TaxID=412755 RepID=A0A0F9M525_9ZZZZ